MTLEEMEKRLQETEKRLQEAEDKIRVNEDIEQIKKLHTRYVNALTFVEWDDIIERTSDEIIKLIKGPKERLQIEKIKDDKISTKKGF